MTEIIEAVEKYFDAWNRHDLTTLRELFSEEVELVDWDVHCVGKEEVILANKKIFNLFPEIRVEVIDCLVNTNSKAMAELKVKIDNETTLNVVDILSFDKSKISSIKAFKR